MQNSPGHWAREQLAVLDCGWERLTSVLERLDDDGFHQPLSEGWNVKEMLAHLAFWEETSVPVVRTILRGGPVVPVEEWYGGTDLEWSPDMPWPDADTHNAREARWARARRPVEVVERLNQARSKLKAIVATVTDEEGRGPIGQQWSGEAICQHVDHHLAQVTASGVSPPST